MRLVKSPASPIINQLGFRDVGKSGVAFSRPSVGVLVRNEIFKEIWGEVERLDQGISAPAPRRGDTFGDLIGKRADKPPHGARSTSQAGS